MTMKNNTISNRILLYNIENLKYDELLLVHGDLALRSRITTADVNPDQTDDCKKHDDVFFSNT